jgi:hypothetical protein
MHPISGATAARHARPLGDSLTVELSALDRAVLVRIQVPQPNLLFEELPLLLALERASMAVCQEIKGLAEGGDHFTILPRAVRKYEVEQAALFAGGLALQQRLRIAAPHQELFATIGALAHFTLRANPSPEAFRAAFDGRMAALAHAHSLAMQNWDADLASLLKAILAPCGREVRGPSIKLAENAAIAFSIATHELATNATKYDSLSRIDGTLNVAWT